MIERTPAYYAARVLKSKNAKAAVEIFDSSARQRLVMLIDAILG